MSLLKAEPTKATSTCGFCAWPPTEAVQADTPADTAQDISAEALSGSQRRWAARPLPERLRVLRTARLAMAERATEFADAISPDLSRTKADTLVTEVLPLLDACRFLERSAAKILKPRKLKRSGRPLWLSGVWAEVHREPLGHILIIGPANFPLFLPGTQTLQALAAGNAVTWKPGTGGRAVAALVAGILREAGLPKGVLRITGEALADSEAALAAGADKVVFTGSSAAGQSIQHKLSATSTPTVMELSGADAVIVLPSADLARVSKAVAFGLGLNGGAVCMSPRRLFATAATMSQLRPLLEKEFAQVAPATVSPAIAQSLKEKLHEATAAGATVRDLGGAILVDHATPAMAITRADLFAPVLSLIEVASMMHVPEQHAACPYGLTAAIFGDEAEARTMAASLHVGSVLINDVIVPTADPRLPFGGRNASGFGVTRGAEGLLEMTAIKTLIVRRNQSTRHLDATNDNDAPLFVSLIQTLHGATWKHRFNAIRKLMKLSRKKAEQVQQEKP